MKKKKLKNKRTSETGAAQMAGPSGPQYDTTGNQRLESKFINYGNWEELVTESVDLIKNKYLTELTDNNLVSSESVKESAVIDNSELDSLKLLAGINKNNQINKGSNISLTGQEKARLMKENNIKPGTPEWFKLWFSRPYMTGEKPI